MDRREDQLRRAIDRKQWVIIGLLKAYGLIRKPKSAVAGNEQQPNENRKEDEEAEQAPESVAVGDPEDACDPKQEEADSRRTLAAQSAKRQSSCGLPPPSHRGFLSYPEGYR